jgi:uncharacterized protein YpmB
MAKRNKVKIWIAVITVLVLAFSVAGYLVYHHHQVVEAAKPKCDHPSIKGNISYRTGVKIYHTPGDRDYDKTVIDTSAGERWFCSEGDAQAAGWRHTEVQ